jgi:hypothetical protein
MKPEEKEKGKRKGDAALFIDTRKKELRPLFPRRKTDA